MPEHAALAIGDGGVPGGFNNPFHREILMIACQNPKGVGTVHVETDKVLEHIQKSLLLEDSLKKVLCMIHNSCSIKFKEEKAKTMYH